MQKRKWEWINKGGTKKIYGRNLERKRNRIENNARKIGRIKVTIKTTTERERKRRDGERETDE